jgi:hypothetical protein
MQTEPAFDGDGVVVEWAPFRLAAGADAAALLEASDAIQRDFLRRQPGFVRRELLRDEAGRWVDLVVWTDHASAMAAMNAAAASPACLAYFHLMEGGGDASAGTDVLHLRRIRAY